MGSAVFLLYLLLRVGGLGWWVLFWDCVVVFGVLV